MELSNEDMTEIVLHIPSNDMEKIYAKSGEMDIFPDDLMLQLIMDGINNL